VGRNLAIAALVAALLSIWLFKPVRAAGPAGFYGMVVAPEVDIGDAIPRLSDLGVRTVRLRMDIRDWGTPSANAGGAAYDNALRQAGPLHRDGFHVMLRVASEG